MQEHILNVTQAHINVEDNTTNLLCICKCKSNSKLLKPIFNKLYAIAPTAAENIIFLG